HHRPAFDHEAAHGLRDVRLGSRRTGELPVSEGRGAAAPHVLTRSFVSSTTPAIPATGGRSAGRALVAVLRPRQWTKNLIVFAGLIFGERLLDLAAVANAAAAFGVFCLLSGIVYVVNDVRDAQADRLHPIKSRRPIAAGGLSP